MLSHFARKSQKIAPDSGRIWTAEAQLPKVPPPHLFAITTMTLDKLQRFIFDETDVRGEIVQLGQSYRQVLNNGSYPPIIKNLLGELLAATSLLSATMKFDGIFTLQARGDGDLSMLVADCTRQKMLRAIAKLQPGANPNTDNLIELLGKGVLSITIDPAQGERYQGVVPLEAPNLSHCLEAYFQQSEQLPTRLWLFADGETAGGLLLQALPAQLQTEEDRNTYFDHLAALANTITGPEFLAIDSEQMLTRLFHQEKVRLYPATEIAFGCSCSTDRTSQMLHSLGEKEAMNIVADQGAIEVQCEFCHQQYRFDKSAVKDIFSKENRILH